MEKTGEQPPSYEHQGYGYGQPQAPPSYNQMNPQQPYPTGQPQPYPAGQPQPYQAGGVPAPQQGYAHQPYPNVVVQRQPMYITTGPIGGPPPDHMTAAIFATLCCFWPTGIVAIIKANDAKSAWMRGDANLAHSSARSAKTMVNVSIIAGICSIILMAIIIGVYVGVIVNNRDYYSSSYNYDD